MISEKIVITEMLDGVQLDLAPDGTLTIDGITLPPIAAVAVRLFMMRQDVDVVLNPLEIIAGQFAE